MTGLRIGHGYDVHRLTEGRRLILGGVEVPYEKGLLGHSDADVLTHAVMDALHGAAALGDIGKLFPDSPFSKHTGYGLFGKIRHSDIELVGYISKNSLVKFLVESCIKILLEEGSRRLETLACHLVRLPVPGSCYIRASCRHLAERCPEDDCNNCNQCKDNPESRRKNEEFSFRAE